MGDAWAVVGVIGLVALWLFMWIGPLWFGVHELRTQTQTADRAFGVAAIVIGVFVLGVPGLLMKTHTDDRSCVRYDHSVQYNPATKTVMPYTYCAQYGEWDK